MFLLLEVPNSRNALGSPGVVLQPCSQVENNIGWPSSAQLRVAEDAEEQPFLDFEALCASVQC